MVPERGPQFVCAYGYKPNIFLCNFQNENRVLTADFKVTRKAIEGAVVDCARLPTEDPIYAVRGEQSLFLYNLKTKTHKLLHTSKSINYQCK